MFATIIIMTRLGWHCYLRRILPDLAVILTTYVDVATRNPNFPQHLYSVVTFIDQHLVFLLSLFTWAC